ncbi:MAG: sugar transferase [Elusimicrobia bacterium]|nr:sugar transferase [Elusimicrobiota bacterium]
MEHLKNKNIYFVFLLIAADCLAFILSFIFAYYFRFYIFANLFQAKTIYSFVDTIYLSLILVPVWIFFVHFVIGYKFFYISKFNLFIKILKTTTSFVVFIFALIFFVKSDYSRMLFVFLFFNLIIFSFVFRYLIKRIISYLIFRLNIRNNLLVIGKNVRKYKKIFNNYYSNKVFYYPYTLTNATVQNLQFLITKKEIKEVIIMNYSAKEELFLPLCDWALENDIDIKMIPNEVQTSGYNIILDDTLGIPVILLISNPVRDFDYFVKRIFDIVASSVALVLLSPLFLVVAIIIKMESKGPVFFAHKRIGYDEKLFACYKFRSMRENANKELKEIKEDALEKKQTFLKLKEDPRITKFGHFIRKYSIDELPQLLNVLKGEMSIVGPRPIVKWELDQIKKLYQNSYNYKKMFKVLPGITGLWQVSGRSLLEDEKRLELEIFYVDNWSLNLDLKIMLKTVLVVFFHKGAF